MCHAVVYTRDFIEKHYVSVKQANPKFPILIRECSGTQPVLWARYGQSVSYKMFTRLCYLLA